MYKRYDNNFDFFPISFHCILAFVYDPIHRKLCANKIFAFCLFAKT